MFFQKIIKLLILVSLGVSIVACGKYDPKIFENYGGGRNRANNYEAIGDFLDEVIETTKIRKARDFGAIERPLVLGPDDFAIPDAGGYIKRVRGGVAIWEVYLDGAAAASAMASDGDGNVYAALSDGRAVSFSKKGEKRWEIEHTKITDDSLIIFSDVLSLNGGVFFFSSDGKAALYSFDGKIIWKKNFGLSSLERFPADESDNIYLPLTRSLFGKSDKLLKINSRGKILWRVVFDKTRIIKPPIFWKGKIYVPASRDDEEGRKNEIIRLSSEGAIERVIETGSMPRFLSGDEDGSIYAVLIESIFDLPRSEILKIDSSGKPLWRKNVNAIIPSPVLVGKNYLAFCGADATAYGAFFADKNGIIRRVLSLSEAPPVRLAPVVSPSGAIVFAGTESALLVRSDLTLISKYIPW